MEHLDNDSLAPQGATRTVSLSLVSPADTNSDDLGSLNGEGPGDGVLSEDSEKQLPCLIIQEQLEEDAQTTHDTSGTDDSPAGFGGNGDNDESSVSIEMMCAGGKQGEHGAGNPVVTSDGGEGGMGYLMYNPTDRTFSLATPNVAPVLILAKSPDQDMFEANVVLDQGGSLGQLLKLQGLQGLTKTNLVTSTQGQEPGTSGTDATTLTVKAPDQGLDSKPGDKAGLVYVDDSCMDALSSFKTLRHQAAHDAHKGLRCTFKGCGRTFTWPPHYKYHQLTHTGQRMYKCDVEGCSASFYTGQRLTVHKRTHTGEKPFVCTEPGCNKSFTTQGNLKNHQRVHTGERPFICKLPTCGRRFAEQSSLRKHSLIHTGEKPFACGVCGKTFQQSSSRKVHMKRHLTAKGETYAETATDEKAQKEKNVAQEPQNMLVFTQTEDHMIEYQDMQGSETVVFTNVVTDHIVTVTTQPSDGEGDHLDLPRGILTHTTEELTPQDAVPAEAAMSTPTTGANVVVLSQPEELVPMAHGYHHGQAGSHEDPSYNRGQAGSHDSYHQSQAGSHEDPSYHRGQAGSHEDPSYHRGQAGSHENPSYGQAGPDENPTYTNNLLQVNLDHAEISRGLTTSDQSQPVGTCLNQHDPDGSDTAMMEGMLGNAISAT